MSRENVETIQRLYDEVLGSPETMIDPRMLLFFDPAVELHQSASLIGTDGTFHGYEGLRRSAREVFEAFRDLHFVPREVVEAGDRVMAVVDAHGYGRDSGVEISRDVVHLYTLREGRIVAWHVYWDVAEGRRAAGLDP